MNWIVGTLLAVAAFVTGLSSCAEVMPEAEPQSVTTDLERQRDGSESDDRERDPPTDVAEPGPDSEGDGVVEADYAEELTEADATDLAEEDATDLADGRVPPDLVDERSTDADQTINNDPRDEAEVRVDESDDGFFGEDDVAHRLPDGSLCDPTNDGDSPECRSGRCLGGPPETHCAGARNFCVAADRRCARPGYPGAEAGSRYTTGGRWYVCQEDGELSIAAGESCDDGEALGLPCASGRCEAGPWGELFCVDDASDCPKPDADGVSLGQSYVHDGGRFSCEDSGLVTDGILDGYLCHSRAECASGACYPGPGLDGQRYCIASGMNCVQPGSPGVRYGDGYEYAGHVYRCVSGTGLVQGESLVLEGYGARPDPTGAPTGGGAGYANEAIPDVVVGTAAGLRDQLAAAFDSGGVVYVADDAQINMLDIVDDLPLRLGTDVTLASGRGRDGAAGALLYIEGDDPRTAAFWSERAGNMFRITGDRARLTGLRIRGTDRHVRGTRNCHPVENGVKVNGVGVVIDNNEVSQWSNYAVYLEYPGTGTHVHHNHIHHNRRYGLGYGISVNALGNASAEPALIEFNVFDWGRHAIAGGGSIGTAYIARDNVVAENWIHYMFDMHRSAENGTSVTIQRNSFYGYHPLGAVHFGGALEDGSEVSRNFFGPYQRVDGVGYAVTQYYPEVTYSEFEGVTVFENRFGSDPDP